MDRMITVNVELGERAYPIHIGADLIGQTALFAPHIAGSSVTIVTNTTVDPLYGDKLRAALAPLLRISWPAKYAFDRAPTLSFALAKTPQFWTLITRMILGEIGAASLDA